MQGEPPRKARDPYLPRLSCLFHAVEHGAELRQPLSIDCGHTLHVLLQAEGSQSGGHRRANALGCPSHTSPQLGPMWEGPDPQPTEAEKDRHKPQTLEF